MTDLNQLAARCYNRLGSELGSFVHDPEMGSLLHTLLRAKNLTDLHEQAYDYCVDALQAEVDKQELREIGEMRIIEKKQHTVVMEIDLVAYSGEQFTVPFEVR